MINERDFKQLMGVLKFLAVIGLSAILTSIVYLLFLK